MNSKKTKHKNRPNKPLNPTPQQSDIITKFETKLEDLQEECALKRDESVPEILNEVVTPPLNELKGLEDESPKKPKRNKGKKKKQDKDENVGDNFEKQVTGPVKDEVDIENESETKVINMPNVTPNIRKKKIKKKTHEQRPEESILPENKIPADNIINLVEITSTEVIEGNPLQTESVKQETKPSKKKVKKKKQRSDSEKSDKSENSICCTTAFQKLLDINDEIPGQKELAKIEDIRIIKKESNISETSIKEECLETKKEINTGINIDEVVSVATEQETPKLDFHGDKQNAKDERNSQKKHKKDKKHPHKGQTGDQKVEFIAEIGEKAVLNFPIEPEDVVSTENITLSEVNQNIELNSFEIETSPKPKAKIAKPVEKKLKIEHEIQCAEISSQSTGATKIEEGEKATEEIIFEAIETKDYPQEDKVRTADVTDKIGSEGVSEESETTLKQELEHLNPVTSKKKNKKILKFPIETEATSEILESTRKTEKNVPSAVTEVVDKIFKEINISVKQESINVVSMQSPMLDVPNITSEFPLRSATVSKECIEQTESVTDCKQQHQDKIFGLENNTGKKKKKLPKTPLQTVDTTEDEKLTEIEPEVLQPHAAEEKSGQVDNKEFVSLVDLKILDIEISSVKADESESSGCEITPDVQYPRALSQQLIDDNNNTFIQEIVASEEIKSNISLVIPDKPLVEGSGETPIATPECVTSGIRVTEIKAKIPVEKEEKTDLKSKMIEVNQDMEELKLSIEKSLAEFTAMEKDEKDIEKQMENTQLKSDEKISKSDLTKAIETEEKSVGKSMVESKSTDTKNNAEDLLIGNMVSIDTPPVCPARKDHKGKGKSKKKEKLEINKSTIQNSTTATDHKETRQEDKKEEKPEQKTKTETETKEKCKQQSCTFIENDDALISHPDPLTDTTNQSNYEPIDNFEDALTSSIDDVNKTFEMIANQVDEANELFLQQLAANKPQINVTAAVEDTGTSKGEKNPVTPPKNLLGHPDIPVPSNKTDYKKEKNKTPNTKQAKVKIKDSVNVEAPKQSKESQTENKKMTKDLNKAIKESFSHVTNNMDEYVYKYSFRKVFLQSSCHICKKDLNKGRIPCNFCNLVFYCSPKHKDEDWPQHQALCFAVSTIVHLKDQKHIYADAKNVTGHNYRLIRMQMIVSCEKVLKRRLVPWEQEALLYPRICADVTCREWRQSKLKDCEGCGQISFCSNNPEHLPKLHQRWCKSYFLYQKLVSYQQTKGRLEPRLPSRVMTEQYQIPEKINEVFASMYEEKIDMNDIQYAALTQLATAPLTATYCHQIYRNKMNCTHINGINKKTCFTIDVVGAELQFEADVLNKWEVFFLHLRPDLKELRIVLVSPDLNPSNLPLDLLGKIKLCDNCRQNKRRVVFEFQDKKNYYEYRSSEEFINPDIVCTFNANIQKCSIYNGKDPWPSTINSILKLKCPFVITSNTMTELRRDLVRINECAGGDYKVISEPVNNKFASVRPDRNFISDDEMPLLFKNYCFAVVCGV